MKDCALDEQSNIVTKRRPKFTFTHTENEYFKLLPIKAVLQATEMSVVSFSQDCVDPVKTAFHMTVNHVAF